MNQITEEQIKVAYENYSPASFPSTKSAYTDGLKDGFTMGIEAVVMQEQMQPEWIPISEYPKDNPVVMRWHKLWKCTVSVNNRRAYAVDGLEWISGTKDNTWPEVAFEPFFMLLPPSPQCPDQ